jgi:hypothetical protein
MAVPPQYLIARFENDVFPIIEMFGFVIVLFLAGFLVNQVADPIFIMVYHHSPTFFDEFKMYILVNVILLPLFGRLGGGGRKSIGTFGGRRR